MNNNWIKCEHQMPDKDGRYIVLETFGLGSTWIGVSALRKGKWDCIAVTHWQNLPEAPKDDNET